MALDLTHGSAMAYETILYGNMTPEMAAEYLRTERISIRSFSDTLRQMYPHKDLQKRLKRFFRDIQTGGKTSSMDRKIQNWMSGHNQPINREDYFRIAFALGLTEAQLNCLLGMCTDYTIQYRDGREAVLAWFLRKGCGYQEAVDFLCRLPRFGPDTDVLPGVAEDVRNGDQEIKHEDQETGRRQHSGEGGSAVSVSGTSAAAEISPSKMPAKSVIFSFGISTATAIPTPGTSAKPAVSASGISAATAIQATGNSAKPAVSASGTAPASAIPAGSSAFNVKGYTEVSRITHEIRDEFQAVRTTEELRECYFRNLSRFGRLHLRSYYYFRQYLKLLIQPLSAAGESEMDYSIETVMDTYLTLQMPMGKKRSNYSLVQKLIKQNWPNTTSVRNIRNQLEDVPRKLLLLLYVVTENSDLKGDYSEFDEDYVSLEERVEDHWWTLNAMLADCGMAPMDLRNAFDWLILYAVSTNGEESMSGRLEGVINELFRDVGNRI